MKLLNTLKRKTIALSTAAFASTVIGAQAFADATSLCGGTTPGQGANCDVSNLESNVSGAIGSGINLIYVASAIIGLGMVIAGVLKLKAHSLDTQQTSGAGKHAVVFLIVGACLIAIPIIMLLVSGSLFGSEGINLPSESGALNFQKQ